jgi:hypothetical protein
MSPSEDKVRQPSPKSVPGRRDPVGETMGTFPMDLRPTAGSLKLGLKKAIELKKQKRQPPVCCCDAASMRSM